MQAPLAALVEALVDATSFEDAAQSSLGAMLSVAHEALAASAWKERGKLVRGMVHLRPDDGYKRLVVVEPRSGGAAATVAAASASGDAYIPSATAWRAVREHRCPVSIDVHLGALHVHSASGVEIVEEQAAGHGTFDSQESRQRMLGRSASHVYAMPLRGAGRSTLGMITLEGDCRAAMGRPFVWSECGTALQLLADVAAQYLAVLPSRPVTTAALDDLLPVVGASMTPLVDMLRVFAQQEETLLVTGPTGAGKSRLARWCHAQSARGDARFESLDLSAVPEDLQLAELFGWRRGAFTGAVKDNPGCIARAEGGTLFIDEIDKLSYKSQAGLLQVLEERTYRVLGEGSGDRRADVRFIVGTNADLASAVRKGSFREDLFYRINVLPVRVPPLDERRDEIPMWADFMATRRHREGGGEGEATVTARAVELLSGRAWPGNLRQLDNIVRRAYAIGLVARNGARDSGPVALDAVDFERALAYESGSTEERNLLGSLLTAATAYIEHAERLRAAGSSLDLDLADAFRGFVLGVGAERLGRDEVFRLLGKEALVAGRNHTKTLRREIERALELARTVSPDAMLPFGGAAER